ncbi:Beta-barrel assembly-enhancing protease [subsurface metagenome]
MIDKILEKKEFEMLMLESENETALNFEAGNPFISDTRVKLKEKERRQIEFPHHVQPSSSPKGLDQQFPDVVTTLSNQLSKLPNNPYVLNNLGLAFLTQRKWEEATKQFKEAIEIKRDFYSAKMNLARALISLKRYEDALNIYKGLKKKHINDTKILMNIAHIYFVQQKLDKSEDLLNKIISMDKENAVAYNNRAVIQIIKENFNKAIGDLRKAIYINTYFAIAENNLGICYVAKGVQKNAVRHFLTALSIDPNLADAAQNLGLSYSKAGEYRKVITLLGKYLERNEFDISARELLAKSYLMIRDYYSSHKQLSLAFKLAKEKYTNDPNYNFFHFYNNFGVTYHKKGDSIKARKFYLKAKKEATSPSEILYRNIVHLYFDIGREDLVETEIKEALELFPDNTNLLLLSAQYCFDSDKREDAISTLNRIIEKNPKLPSAYAFLSFMYSEVLLNYELAIETLNKGLEYNKGNRFLSNNLAYNYLMKDDTAKARTILDAVEDIEGNVFLTATRGLLLLKEGDVKEGTTLYNRAAALARDNSILHDQVEQKKNLELARFYYSKGKKEDANKYLKRVLNPKLRPSVYCEQGEKFTELVHLSRD